MPARNGRLLWVGRAELAPVGAVEAVRSVGRFGPAVEVSGAAWERAPPAKPGGIQQEHRRGTRVAGCMREVLFQFLLVPVLFVGAGIFFAVWGFRRRPLDESFIRSARRVSGVLTDVRWRSVGVGADSLFIGFPVVRFTTTEGQVAEVETNQGRSPAPGRKGQAVMVLYDPADPTRVLVEDFLGQGKIILGCMGVFGVLVALFGFGMGAALALLIAEV